jgi:omega-6 fatty acid desaturase (delta-12 desaturase)
MLNRLVGRFCSLITLIPFTAWKEEHQEHHASFGKVDEQTFGDIWLMTVDQYRSSTWRTRCIYRIFRSRTFLLLIAPFGYLLVRQRIPSRLTRQRIFSILIHTLMIGGLYGLVFQAAGPLLWMVWLPPLYIASTIGVIIFAVEHQFDGTQWENKSDWEFYDAAVNSSSYLTMPRFLEWFTGSIGYHHLHHMSPRIPSYRLRECFFAVGNKLPCKKITIYSIPRQLQLTLWSAKTSRLISFREARSSYS